MSVTFIAPMHNEVNFPEMFVASMMCQTNPDWRVIIYHNGPNSSLPELIKKTDERFVVVHSETNTGNWGTLNRIDAITNLVTTSHCINTSIQDYWIPTAVAEITPYLDKDFIYWNSINHLFGYHTYLNSEPTIGRVDWGNFAIKTSIAKAVNINKPTDFNADGIFVKDCFNSGLIQSQVKISKILTIHN